MLPQFRRRVLVPVVATGVQLVRPSLSEDAVLRASRRILNLDVLTVDDAAAMIRRKTPAANSDQVMNLARHWVEQDQSVGPHRYREYHGWWLTVRHQIRAMRAGDAPGIDG